MTIRCPVCGDVCVWEYEDNIYRHIDTRTDCRDFCNPKRKISKESDIKTVYGIP